MCMKSDHAVMAFGASSSSSSSSSGTAAKLVDVDTVKQCLKEKDAIVVDVREPDELTAEGAKTIPGAINYPLGPLLRDSAEGNPKHGVKDKKEIVLVCNVGYRSGVAAQQLASFGFPAASLDGGVEAFHAPRAAWLKPQYVVVLETADADRATLALSVATAAQVNGRTTAFALMAKAPLLFRKEGVDSDVCKRYVDINVGEPFKPMAKLVEKFVSSGGTIFACKSCVIHSGLEYSKMDDLVYPGQAPDLVRMTAGAEGSTCFA
ncbi:hypothetical protein PTSG_10837 [Salpingoeca rosetta]|uniref:Rhodanese domain-containing protein n=1 Tax=Salpingoeca rosetta (strain ATCC 50818 / BSB-021) TaxID=946362 RepID=F2URI6_SALR5|nr:uncharacterized protein PTSG_10837 [Salpingoeca rosetta]EGD80155.1 hypothetical protein PTSG_10837 [Salpingoeca rosetta]|eukprot:XP_004988217.1 hypothetical protein PTSG_10837 [Salpingoeca rosetta]